MIHLFSRRLCLCHCLCIRLCLWICVPNSFLNSYYHKLSENVWVWGCGATRSEIWTGVTIAGRTTNQTTRQGKIELLSQWTMEGWDEQFKLPMCRSGWGDGRVAKRDGVWFGNKEEEGGNSWYEENLWYIAKGHGSFEIQKGQGSAVNIFVHIWTQDHLRMNVAPDQTMI